MENWIIAQGTTSENWILEMSSHRFKFQGNLHNFVYKDDMKFTNFVYGRYNLILIVILHENNLNRSAF